MKKTPTFVALALLGGALNASAVVIAMTADSGGRVVSGSYVLATTGTVANTNNYPSAESPDKLVDGLTTTKYLNFAKTDTGVAMTAGTNASVPIDTLTFTTANDAVERDPTGYQLYGANTVITGGTAVSSLTLIASGSLTLSATRGASTTVSITNTTAYSNYLIIFPTVSNPTSANSMQIAEVKFEGSAVPEAASSLLLVAGALPMLRRRRR